MHNLRCLWNSPNWWRNSEMMSSNKSSLNWIPSLRKWLTSSQSLSSVSSHRLQAKSHRLLSLNARKTGLLWKTSRSEPDWGKARLEACTLCVCMRTMSLCSRWRCATKNPFSAKTSPSMLKQSVMCLLWRTTILLSKCTSRFKMLETSSCCWSTVQEEI